MNVIFSCFLHIRPDVYQIFVFINVPSRDKDSHLSEQAEQ